MDQTPDDHWLAGVEASFAVSARDGIQPPFEPASPGVDPRSDHKWLKAVEAAVESDTTGDEAPALSAPFEAQSTGVDSDRAGEGAAELNSWFERVEDVFPPPVERASVAGAGEPTAAAPEVDDARLSEFEATSDAGAVPAEWPTPLSATSVGFSGVAAEALAEVPVEVDAWLERVEDVLPATVDPTRPAALPTGQPATPLSMADVVSRLGVLDADLERITVAFAGGEARSSEVMSRWHPADLPVRRVA